MHIHTLMHTHALMHTHTLSNTRTISSLIKRRRDAETVTPEMRSPGSAWLLTRERELRPARQRTVGAAQTLPRKKTLCDTGLFWSSLQTGCQSVSQGAPSPVSGPTEPASHCSVGSAPELTFLEVLKEQAPPLEGHLPTPSSSSLLCSAASSLCLLQTLSHASCPLLVCLPSSCLSRLIPRVIVC